MGGDKDLVLAGGETLPTQQVDQGRQSPVTRMGEDHKGQLGGDAGQGGCDRLRRMDFKGQKMCGGDGLIAQWLDGGKGQLGGNAEGLGWAIWTLKSEP